MPLSFETALLVMPATENLHITGNSAPVAPRSSHVPVALLLLPVGTLTGQPGLQRSLDYPTPDLEYTGEAFHCPG
jgi:hypothetical protein